MIRTPTGLVLLGSPVSHSLSPLMHTAALAKAGLHLRYIARDVGNDELTDVVREIKERRFAGNVTVPHKAAMWALCDSLTSIARRTGAVNTFWVQGDRLCGDNTDVGGFDYAVREVLTPFHGMKVTLIGAGGAAAAVGTAVEQWSGARLTLWNRSQERTRAFVQRFDTVRVETSLSKAVEDADLVINSTPIGLTDDNFPVDIDLLPPHAVVFDLVYKPGETAWVREARARGHHASDGIGMLVEQGALAFSRWFGFSPDREVMWKAILESSEIKSANRNSSA